jgi:hypothetical protein
LERRQTPVVDPQADTYPVANDGAGIKAFRDSDATATAVPTSAARVRRDDHAAAGRGQMKSRQDADGITNPESDTYPVTNDETGVKAL